MRAVGRDLTEIFGYAPDDNSNVARDAWQDKQCQFVNSPCTKKNHDQTITYGVCSVSIGGCRAPETEVIICPKRIYANQYSIFRFLVDEIWGVNMPLIIGGTPNELKNKLFELGNAVVAFGQASGSEISISANGKLSMDWIFQHYMVSNNDLIPIDFVGAEVQSIDTTGNYRSCWNAYAEIKNGIDVKKIPDSEHGLNWANVHKRLIPQIIRKGAIYSKSDRCRGFYFIVPDAVYEKFEQVIGGLQQKNDISKDNLSIITLGLGAKVSPGNVRQLIVIRRVNYLLGDVAAAFIGNASPTAPRELDLILRQVL
jgi:hypothetical protein